MNKQTLFKIQRKYLDILSWLINNDYTYEYSKKDSLKSLVRMEQQHKRDELFIYGEMEISRGYDGIEMGSPTRKDLIDYSLTTKFTFRIGPTLEAVKNWHKFLDTKQDSYFRDKSYGKPFENCHLNAYRDDNKVQTETPYKFGVGVKQGPQDCNNYELKYFIPISITYTVDKITIEPKGLTNQEIEDATII